jgi:alkylated DNA repair protein (DNA oxidative demethylase)
LKGPPPSNTPARGERLLREDGFSYLPRFIELDEAQELADFFAALTPIWEQRFNDERSRNGRAGRLTRPVYWLGAWQFAALGYYAEPLHLSDRCVRAEPLPGVMLRLLERLRPEMERHGDSGPLPNTCLINYYGSERKIKHKSPVDFARLSMHRDAEPGSVVMFSIGQPAQFEFVEDLAEEPQHSQWVRHRSVIIISGDEYKDRLYHRITRVRHGQEPALEIQLPYFNLRRVSVSFRHVPERYIYDLGELSTEAQSIAQPYVEQLSQNSEHFRQQLGTLKQGPNKIGGHP